MNSTLRKLYLPLLIVILIALITVSSALAQDEQPDGPSDDAVNAIAKDMYCPVCENTPLDVCPTQACAEWRELIRDKLAEGWTEEQIEDYFVQQFGDRVLAQPPARGLNWLVYIIPPIVFLAGVYILYRVIQSYREPLRKSVDEASSQLPADSPDDEYIHRLEEELRNL